MRIIGYTYEADVHCPACTEHRAAIGVLKRQPPLQMRTDEHGIAMDLIDRQGNPVNPLHDIDGAATELTHCGTCYEEL